MIEGLTNYGGWEGRALLKHPALNLSGKRNKLLGRGTFARVYASTPGRVLKVTTDEMAYWAHCDTAMPLTGKHYPTVYRDFGVIGQLAGHPVYMIEVERLNKDYTAKSRLPYYITEEVRDWAGNYGEKCSTDIHEDNVMTRPGTGDPVASDPVCDMDQINQHWRRERDCR